MTAPIDFTEQAIEATRDYARTLMGDAPRKPPPSPETIELRRLASAATLLTDDAPLVGQIKEAMLKAADNLDLLRAEKDPPLPPPQSRLAAAIENLSRAFRDIGLDPPVALVLKSQGQVWHLEACMQQDGFMAEDKTPGSASQIMGMQIRCERRP